MTNYNQLICGDAITEMKKMPDDFVDLIFFSPPYEDCRTYGIDFNLKGQEYIDWLVGVFRESVRVCKGLTACVIQGKTRKYKWSATPALLMADLHRAGFNLRRPVIYHRSGIPGSGGPDWLRCDHEYIICVSKPGRLPWSDNTACGDSPLFRVGGLMSHRHKDGTHHNHGARNRTVHKRYLKEGEIYNGKETIGNKLVKIGGKLSKSGQNDGASPSHGGLSGTVNEDGTITRKDGTVYTPPKIANPGDVIKSKVGGGHIGSILAHENEAPFPEKLAEFFIKSFCPPDGIVLDPFCGSGTSCAVARRLGRKYLGIDIRQSQIDLTQRRLNES